jgi:CRISPR-associated endonuclease/helicase Cas3
MPVTYYAHSRPGAGREEWDPLIEHCERTAGLTAEFCRAYAPEAGRLAGLWHDLGKFQPKFQEYLRKSAEAGHEEAKRTPHSIVGAYHASRCGHDELAMIIQAHHGALHAHGDHVNEVEGGAGLLFDAPKELLENRKVERAPQSDKALWTRFIFSALVDADTLDSERWDKGKTRWRCELSPTQLLETLKAHLEEKGRNAPPTEMNELRARVQRACEEAAKLAPGAFRLTVPTGGGKTLGSILFALAHAREHGMRRVIVVIPFTSIIDQTADQYRKVFGEDAVLEHHSNLDPAKEDLRHRLCTENWDSPIVVTTSVRFFETLHAAHKRDLRKLHNVAESVVILDEVQTFPLELIAPIKQALNRLTAHFRVTTVHCSATQPMLAQPQATEIVPDPGGLFSVSRSRVAVRWPEDPQPMTWQALAEKIRKHPQGRVLAIVHKKRDAIDLARAVGDDCIHLSTLMCAAHRRKKLAEILPAERRCLVVSTQLVEAGVDVDFPVVYRALGGVDSLAQAAGRCNREGRMAGAGEFHVFVGPSEPPRGTLANGAGVVKGYLLDGGVDLFAPDLPARYFQALTELAGTSSKIPELEKRLNFPEVARLFRMIDDEGTPVIAPYGDEWRKAVAAVRAAPGISTFRRLQAYTVSLDKGWLGQLQDKGALEPLLAGSEESWIVRPGYEAVYSDRFGFGGEDTPLLVI